MTSTTTDTRPRSAWATYGQWWVRTPGSALYLLTVFVLAMVSLTVLITLLSTGVTYERDGYKPQWRGIYDDQDRLMVVINFNMDLGDGWEHADTPEYSLQYTTRAYQYAINYIVYAMTH